MQKNSALIQTSNILSFTFTCIILVYAASGPISEFVRWFIEFTTIEFDTLSRRDQRILFKTHWLGAIYKNFEQSVLLPTGMILGLPVLFSFLITAINLKTKSSIFNWCLATITAFVFIYWIVNLFAVDVGAVPSADRIDYVLFPIATLIALYLTWRHFGFFIVCFSIFWIVYFFIRGLLPDWVGIFAGTENTFVQSMRSMVLNFWSQTGGMFGQPLQVVSGNVLIFLVFGSVLMACGAGNLLMKVANRLTGHLTGGSAHAAIASSALLEHCLVLQFPMSFQLE